jgi:tryptophan halogenase
VDNVVAIGNAGGFVEPLEATALMAVCSQCKTLVDFLLHTSLEPTPTMRRLYNDQALGTWLEIRDFLGLHYRLNSATETPFWRHCREDTDLEGIAELLEFYHENGPTGFCRYRLPSSQSNFGIEGYLTMLVGNKAPYRNKHRVTSEEKAVWDFHRKEFEKQAAAGLTVKEALEYVRHPGWQWFGESNSL